MPTKLKAHYEYPYPYTDAGQETKKMFHRDGRKYFNDVASIMGLEVEISINPSGMVDLGYVNAYILIDETNCFELCLSQSLTNLSGRKDRLSLMARKSTYEKKGKGKGKGIRIKEMGTNNWMDARDTSDVLAGKLKKMTDGCNILTPHTNFLDINHMPDYSYAVGIDPSIGSKTPEVEIESCPVQIEVKQLVLF